MNGIGGVYAEGRERISKLVLELTPEEAATRVPACPDWDVRDVIAHLAGTCADAIAGNMDGVTTAAWADAQVRRRRGRTVTELVDEWSTLAPQLESVAADLPPPLTRVWVLDLTAHEHDVRGAIGRPGARESRGLDVGLEVLVRDGLHGRLAAVGLGPLAVRTSRASWVVGEGSGDDGRQPAAVLECSTFELFRTLTGRRSKAQIAGMAWTGDAAPFVPAFEFGTFTTSAVDIVE